VLVSDILEDASAAFGSCVGAPLYRRLTDAVKALNNKGITDLQLAEADFCVYDGLVTLPMEVDAVQSVLVDGQPSFARSQWYQYSLAGSGWSQCTGWGYADELGRVSTYRDPSIPSYLVAQLENVQDNNSVLIVRGWDATGKRITTLDGNGNAMDGFLVPTIYGFQNRNPDVAPIAKIDTITISGPTTAGVARERKGFVRLVAIDPADNTSVTQIGYYQPWETAPSYRRLRVKAKSWVRVKYRRKDLEIRGPGDWINVENREALLLMCRAVKARADNQFDLARSAEGEAVRILNDAASASNPVTQDGACIVFSNMGNGCGNDDSLIYGNGGYFL
jgi:hypothetical protein